VRAIDDAAPPIDDADCRSRIAQRAWDAEQFTPVVNV
jgi:hypothetical protein